LIDVIAKAENICNYVDIPVQHISGEILRNMNRSVTRDIIVELIGRIRARIENVVLRTSVITGFPGETDEQFCELIDFLEEIRFERLGAFIYSKEEGTKAYSMSGHIPEEIKRERFDEVMKVQQDISRKNNLRYMGKKMKVLVDERLESASDQFLGRTYMDAPEVDGSVYISGSGIKTGDFTSAVITGTMEYDLIGEVDESA